VNTLEEEYLKNKVSEALKTRAKSREEKTKMFIPTTSFFKDLFEAS